MGHLLITAVVCTHNRANFLHDALTGLAIQTLDADKYEILIVDNISKDNTVQIVREWKKKIQNLSYFYEENLGLSHARNRGFKEAKAPIVAYLDDDAIPESQWLESLLGAYAEITPSPVAVGGKILLKWQGPQPAWLDHIELLHPLGLNDQGNIIKPTSHMFGGNMSFRKDILVEYDGFDHRLGRQGSLQLTSEESELQLRMRTDGHILYYQPTALVWHQINAEKQSPEYLVKRFFAHGQTDAFRYALNAIPSRFTVIKLMLREFMRNKEVIFKAYKAYWLGKIPPSSERYLIKCRLFQLYGFQKQMLYLLKFSDHKE